jgi:2,3-bisphosphoglycerate-dependent phosphoglycerate mutase
MGLRIVFETHSWSEDNERGLVSGWRPGRLTDRGRALARELGDRRRDDGVAAVFSSDLARAVETAELAFAGTGLPVLHDWRLRECDHGELNGAPLDQVKPHLQQHLTAPYPGGESWEQAIARVAGFLQHPPARWRDDHILVIGHVATKWALDIHLRGASLRELAAPGFGWQEGWEYAAGRDDT